MKPRFAAAAALLALLAVPVVAGAAPAKATAHGVLPFIEDDYAQALAAAKAAKKPVFVDVWAPW